MKILVTPTSMRPDKHHPALERLKAYSDDIRFNTTGKPMSGDALIDALQGCEGYLAGLDFISQEVLAACPELKVISRYGAGYDRVDLRAATARGILVANTPGANAQSVAELAFGMMLSLARHIAPLDKSTKNGQWVRSTGVELYGKTLGIIGLGAIGRKLAECVAGFSMKVIAYDPRLDEAYCRAHSIIGLSFEDVIRRSDFLSLHLPLTDATRHLINGDAFRMMRDGAILVNASRGGLVDENAACDALESGKLGGLGLDAFESEPPVCPRLFSFDTVLATPHTGAHTAEAVDTMAHMAVDNLIAALSGHDCRFILNRPSA